MATLELPRGWFGSALLSTDNTSDVKRKRPSMRWAGTHGSPCGPRRNQIKACSLWGTAKQPLGSA